MKSYPIPYKSPLYTTYPETISVKAQSTNLFAASIARRNYCEELLWPNTVSMYV